MKTIPTLTSKDNPLIKTMRLVAHQARRAPADVVLAEGLRVLEEATRAGSALETVVVSQNFGRELRERTLLDAWIGRGVQIRRATSAVLKGLSNVVTSQGAFALVRVPWQALDDLEPPPNPLILCLCGIQDPGNLGTLIRSAGAAGAALVCCLEGTVSARNPKALRASAGAFFRIPVVEGIVAADFLVYCRKRGIAVAQASARAGTPVWALDLTGPCALLLGNETRGVYGFDSEGIASVHVPMRAGVESLNVAVAGAILLFEAMRQRSADADTCRER